MKLADLFSTQAQFLTYRAKRSETLARNLANADTPGYKAQDVAFSKVYHNQAQDIKGLHANHMTTQKPYEVYEVPVKGEMRPDGNTVDSQREIAAFTENAIKYRASLNFINGQIKGIMTALRGE